MKPINKLVSTKKIDKDIAYFIDTSPEAIDRYFFVGCFLSFSLSMESFIKYIDEEIKQNAINALIEVNIVCVSKEKAKRGAKNTSRFLVH